ncbi:CII family transcriptional regulator [Escherichia coli]|uniref:CII family transcriptional regulator n=1 Tax=Escherichia coli TaxID=562 RepID=UPI00259CE462|nr:CII family transcriptional regulator [Escherichia coli]MDM4902345.1 CII family transcriptional regulator [Escherichia coli]
MDLCVNKRNEALRIESELFNKIVLFGLEKIAKVAKVDKSQISRWKRDWTPKSSQCCLLPTKMEKLDDDMARLALIIAIDLH